MKKQLLYLILVMLCGYHSILNAAVKGSATSVSIEPNFTFPAADSNNKMLGFGWFKNGFSLEDASTTCDFASVYPVSGIINLNGGTLNLLEDLILKNFTLLQGLGTISGNNYSLEFCSTITSLPLNTETFKDLYMVLSNGLELQGVTRFAGTTVLDGRGQTLHLGASGAIVVASGSTLTLKDISLKGVNAQNIRCEDDTATLVLDNVKWVQSGDVIFDHGALYIQDKAEFYGNYRFAHTSPRPITIGKQSVWSVLASVDIELGKRRTQGAVYPLVFEDHSSTWKLSNCSLLVTEAGLQLTKGKLIFDEQIEIDMQSTNTTNGLIFGDGLSSENDFSIRFNAGVSVTHAGHTVYNNTTPNKLDSLSKNAKMIRELNSNIFIAKDIIMPSMTLESVSNIVPPIQSAQGVSITYQDDQVLLPAVAFDITGRQEVANAFLMEGSDEIFFTKGSLPLNLYVSGLHNFMHGNGGVSGLLALQDHNSQLICSVLGPINRSPELNGGTLTLAGDFVLGPDIILHGPGIVDLTTCRMLCGAKDIVWTDATTWQGNDGSIEMQGGIALNNIWTIDGLVTLDGNNNTLDLSEGGQIVVNQGATLRCKNVRIIGIGQKNIRCVDDTAKLILEDVVWMQSDDFDFDNGTLSILDQVDFLGTYTFRYLSKQSSSIAMKSEWHVTDDMRFEIGKHPADGAWPLSFEDYTSVLHLDNCNYVITGSGMQIINGTIMYSRNVEIDILSTNTTNGSFIGNGIAQNDPIVQFTPGAAAHFRGGHLVWDVVDSSKLRSDSTSVNLQRSDGNTYYVKQNLALKNFTVTADASVITNFAPGKTLFYDQCLFTLPNGRIAISGSRYNAYTSLLAGNNSIFLHYGTLPLATFVMGPNNMLSGNGIVSGPVVLLSPASNLAVALAGSISSSIHLSGGTLVLSQDAHITNGAIIADSGTVNLNASRLQLSSKGTVWPGTIHWQSAGASIALDGDLALAGNWIFHNNCTIQGYGNVIDLSRGGNISVAPGATLKLSNVRIRGIKGTNISCLDDTSSLILDQVVWVQEGDFNFDHGSITFNDSVDFLGSYTFVYASKRSSTINEKSTWHLTDYMHFVMGKQPDPDAQNPLLLLDQTATLHLDNCSFIVTHSGWNLLKGCIQFSRDVSIEVVSTSLADGVEMGDGTPDNDPLVFFDPGCNARFLKGYLIYNIVNSSNLHSDSTTVQMIRLADSHFLIKQNVVLKNFTVDSSQYAYTEIEDGITFRYENCIFVLPDGRTNVTGYRYNAVSNLLTMNDMLFMQYGYMPMATFVQASGNSISGTGDVTGPIIFLGPSASLTWGLIGSMNSFIMLNGGTLNLQSDLHLRETSAFTTGGIVNLNALQLSLGSKDTEWSSTIAWNADGARIEMNANIALTGTWSFNGNCTINGNGNVFDFGKLGIILIGPGSQLTLRNMRLTGVVKNSIAWADDSSGLTLDNVSWVQAGDFTLDKGSILFRDNVDFSGPHIFSMDTHSTSTIDYNSRWNISETMSLSLGKATEESANPLYFKDGSSTLHLNNCTFSVSKNGLDFTRGHVLCSGDVNVEINSTSTMNGLRLGNGTVDGDMVFEFNPGANVTYLPGHAVYDVTVPTSVLSRSTGATLTRAAGSVFYIKQDVLLENLTVDASMYATTNVAPSKSFTYKNATLHVPGGAILVNGERYNAYTNLLGGNQSIFLEAGSNPMYTVVAGVGNYILGNGSLTGQTILLDPNAQLMLSIDGLVTEDVILNGGTVGLGQNLKFATNHHFAGSGTVALGGNQLDFGPQKTVWSAPITWQGDGGQIDFHSDVALSSVWTFTHQLCVIDCNNNVLDLSSNGQILVASGATLHLKNVEIKGIAAQNISCLDNSSKLILENVTWVQSDDYQFAKGSICWKHANEMSGNATFAYQTTQASTIAEQSCLSLNAGFTFSYDCTRQDLLKFSDATASLRLKGAILSVNQGITLTRGTLVIRNNSTVASSSVQQGITIGTGNVDDDCIVIVGSGVQLTVAHGALNYKNSSLASWNSGNSLSAVYLADNTVLNLYQSLDAGVGGFVFGKNTVLNRAHNADIAGSLTVQGELSFGSL